ncbi:MAG: cysteinyl-tRNA synthetase [Chloroflexi bacterium]|nr:cysteinyl-tRNA synthetase [Chloroflexota bacterium]
MSNPDRAPLTRGRIALFGSGETAKVGRRVHELLLAAYAKPVPVAVLETPAGFQPNSGILAAKVKAFFEHSLQNFKPDVTIVPARRREGEPVGTDDRNVAELMGEPSYVFAGAGSPTYAVRHLLDTRLWRAVLARLEAGATLALASAMALASSHHTLPVYEIYKVGEDPGWTAGLDLFGASGLDLTIVPHWNNKEGGAELDTSHCYMGTARFDSLREQLPSATVVLGIDEHTVCVVDLTGQSAQVHGVGVVTVERDGEHAVFGNGQSFSLDLLRR